jgi:uncharacterized protein (DUF1778 family)
MTTQVEADDVADRVSFALSPEDWQSFCDALDAPARDIPELRRLLREPGVFNNHSAETGQHSCGVNHSTTLN